MDPNAQQQDPQFIGNVPVGTPAGPVALPPPGADQLLSTPANLYGENGMMTHAGMLAQIQRGGSVMYNGKVIARVQDAPSAAELNSRDVEHANTLLADARTPHDKARAQRLFNSAQQGTTRTTADIDRQISDLQAQRDSLAKQSAQEQIAAIGKHPATAPPATGDALPVDPSTQQAAASNGGKKK